MRAWLAIGLGGLAAACSSNGSSALEITVRFDNSQATCVAAGVQLEGTSTLVLSGVPRGTKPALVFGIAGSSTLKGKVIPFARGYRAADCANVAGAVFEESVTGPGVDLDQPGVQKLTLTLTGKPGADGGNDAGPDAGADAGPDGGADAGLDGGGDAGFDAGSDAGFDAGCAPASAENCLDGVDNTCDGLIDCADPGCSALPCAGGGTCGLQPDGGLACLQPVETVCGDGMDNDGDGKIDCADSDCAGKACNDGNACTSADLCNAFTVPDGGGFCDGGAPLVCSNLQLNCRASSGVCVPASGACVFAPLDGGQPCDDGIACTYADRCNAAASCAGVPYACATSQCIDAGTCLGDGGCAFVYASASTACDDLTNCTFADKCDGLGVCGGTSYSCSTPPVCFTGTACLGDGGCGWTFNGVGTSCPSGLCAADAGCAPFATTFGYAPSNFDPTAIPDASIAPATTFSGCTVEFDSTNNVSADGGWCGQVMPTPFVFDQDGGISTTLLAMSGLTLAADANLIVYGSRPVILAVFGRADLQGVIDARSVDATRLGPGGSYAGCATMNGQTATFSGGGGGGSFGTAGTPGAGFGAGATGDVTTDLSLNPLRGGCQGGPGARAEALGGPGGGAVQVSSSSLLTVGGTVSTSGGGGLGAPPGDNGGGGGGSGGAILLEGSLLALSSSSRLICSAGAGGGGSESLSAVTGQSGESGALDSLIPARGGQGGAPTAGDGGSGAAGLTPAGNPATGSGGSGGGGAGLGVIRLNGALSCVIADGGLISGALSKSALCP